MASGDPGANNSQYTTTEEVTVTTSIPYTVISDHTSYIPTTYTTTTTYETTDTVTSTTETTDSTTAS